jgi:hypothetical protein
MKLYLAPNRVPILGTILLVGGSIIIGLLIGAIAYFISNFIYYIFVFSLAVGILTMFAYYKLLQFSKVRHSIIAAFIGLVTGVFVALAFYGTPYLITRNDYINLAKQNNHISTVKASADFNIMLLNETGSSGFWGYLKLRAKEGDKYTNYLMENGLPIHEFSFTLKSNWAWLYWFFELVFFSVPTAYIGFEVGTRFFNDAANDWYNPIPREICAMPLNNKEKLLILLKECKLHEISELSVSEDDITHPKIEIYEQHSNNKKGDVLLSVKQTYHDKKLRIKRETIGQWEVSNQEYISFTNWLTNKFTR